MLTSAIKSCHAGHSSLEGLFGLLLRDDHLDSSPLIFIIIQPLVGSACDVSTQRLSQDKHITWLGIVRPADQDNDI